LKEEAGIVTSLEIGNISRLDICRTVTLPRLVPEYQEVIRSLTFPRMKATHYYSGARWSNKQREISLYDKTKEQTSTRGKEGEDSRECRLEYRMVKGEAVANHYGSKVAYDLTTEKGFEMVLQSFAKMTDKLFSLDVEDLSDACETGVGPAVERLSEERKFLAAVAAHYLTQQQKEEAIRAAAKDHRQKASRLRKDLQEGMKNAAYLSEEGKTEAKLYAELKAAFTELCDK
jgi:hypothetical protein